MSVAHIGSEIGVLIEYDIPIEPDYEVFKMRSYYYQCEVRNGLVPQKLEDYEQELGFSPVWIDVDHALQRNRAILQSDNAPKWLKKDVFVLEYIRRNILLMPEP